MIKVYMEYVTVTGLTFRYSNEGVLLVCARRAV